jgi:FMN phosphatase YigB (HAD superfamily)
VKYSTILFDVGDTLVQVPKPAPIYHQILTCHGACVELAEVEEILAETRRLLEEREPNWVTEDLVLDAASAVRRRDLHVDHVLTRAGLAGCDAARSAFFDIYVGTGFFTIFPDVVETLDALRSAGYRLGIVSNWEARLLELCAAHGIADRFDFAVISEIEGFSKPHPHLYRRALELAAVPAEQVVHVGDKLREDVEGASSVGIRAVLLDRKGDPAVEYEPRISSLAELPALLAGL